MPVTNTNNHLICKIWSCKNKPLSNKEGNNLTTLLTSTFYRKTYKSATRMLKEKRLLVASSSREKKNRKHKNFISRKAHKNI